MLEWCELGDDAKRSLGFLDVDNILEWLYLEECDEGADILAQSLTSPQCRLQALSLLGCEVSYAGWQRVCAALKANTTIKCIEGIPGSRGTYVMNSSIQEARMVRIQQDLVFDSNDTDSTDLSDIFDTN